MEESLRVRIDKIFGSLASSSAASSAPVSSLWCLAEDEINGNERSGGEEVPRTRPSQFDSNSFPEAEDLRVYGEEGGSSGLEKPEDYSEEEWEIRSSIGMDTTLDMEEEEDENDKLAVGEKLYNYTKDVNDYETEADEWEELPSSLTERDKDPRANHAAAQLRLKQDAEAVNKLNSLHVSELSRDSVSKSTSEETHVGSLDNNGLKPILKRRENQPESRLQKRVRFSSDTRDDDLTGGDKDSVMETSSPGELTFGQPDYSIGIPDYLRNPSKYTCYTFDEGDVDEESNRKAYMDFLNMVRRRDETLSDPMIELPKSVAFVPKKKPVAESKVENVDKGSEGRRNAIAVVDVIEDNNISSMEEDEPEMAQNVVRKPGRQYRSRAKEDQEE